MATLAPVTPPAATTAPPPPTAAPTTLAATTTAPPPETTTSTTTTTLPPSPLNGLGVVAADNLDRRVMAVKIDNHVDARPQSGLQEAEAVFELLVEGGLSRFIALFHTVDSGYVGPIRSIRPTDPTLLKPLGAPLQISGGQAWVRSLVSRLGVDFMGEVTGPSTFRIGSRSAPHNLYGDTAEMRDRADRLGFPDDPPPPMYVFGNPTPHDAPATTVTFSWSAGNDVVWRYGDDGYARFHGSSPHLWESEDGDAGQITFDTLLVLVTRRYTATPRPSESGTSVPALDTVGTGTALLFYDGGVVEGTWNRSSIEEPFALTTRDEAVMILPPGLLWISVFPSNRTVEWE
jgi:hypothetical protein